MASMYGYVTLVVGLSILLGLAGLSTGIGGVLDMFAKATINQLTGEMSINFDTLNQFKNDFWGTWQSLLLLGGAIVGISVAIATKDFPQALKATTATVIVPLIIADFVNLMSYGKELGSMGIVVTIISWVIYLPLTIALFVTVSNWIQGRD